MSPRAEVLAVHKDSHHSFSKTPAEVIELRENWGVVGDAHAGVTVQHLSRIKADPTTPNLRQVHLMHQELFDWLQEQGFEVQPGALGENITTSGLDILGLPQGSKLHIGAETVVEVTGLRNPCSQINDYQSGLLKKLVEPGPDGTVIRRGGIMGIVLRGGEIRAGDAIDVELPAEPHQALERV